VLDFDHKKSETETTGVKDIVRMGHGHCWWKTLLLSTTRPDL